MRRLLQGRVRSGLDRRGFPKIVISLVGSILAIRVGGSLGGILRMLDSQLEIPQGWLDVLDRKLDELLGKLATQDSARRC